MTAAECSCKLTLSKYGYLCLHFGAFGYAPVPDLVWVLYLLVFDAKSPVSREATNPFKPCVANRLLFQRYKIQYWKMEKFRWVKSPGGQCRSCGEGKLPRDLRFSASLPSHTHNPHDPKNDISLQDDHPIIYHNFISFRNLQLHFSTVNAGHHPEASFCVCCYQHVSAYCTGTALDSANLPTLGPPLSGGSTDGLLYLGCSDLWLADHL